MHRNFKGDCLLSRTGSKHKVVATGTASGNCNVSDFLGQLRRTDEQEFASARLLIDKVAEKGHGHPDNLTLTRKVEGEVWELKPPVKGRQVRLYFYFREGTYFICHAQLKKDTRITKRDKKVILLRAKEDIRQRFKQD